MLRGVRKGVSLSLAAVGLGVRRGLAALVTSGHVEKCATRGTLGGRERVRLALVRGEDGGRSRVRSSLSDVVIRGGGGVSRGGGEVSSGLATLAAVRFGRERLDEARRGVSLALAAVGGLSRGRSEWERRVSRSLAAVSFDAGRTSQSGRDWTLRIGCSGAATEGVGRLLETCGRGRRVSRSLVA